MRRISNLFNTGVNNAAVPLPVLSQDPHYFLTASADVNCPINLAPRVEGLGNTWVNTNNAISACDSSRADDIGVSTKQ